MKKLICLLLLCSVFLSLSAMAYADSFYPVYDLKVGSIVTLGAYEQDNDPRNGPEPIEWIVLQLTDSGALLISRYALDCMAYNNYKTNVTWGTSSLRAWLNDTFYYSAFSADERSLILTTRVEYETDVGSGARARVNDRIYIPSYDEAVSFWSKSSGFKNWSATAYAIAHADAQGEEIYSYPEFYFWLRTPGNQYARNCPTRADCVRQDGPNSYGHSVEHVNGAVRPMMRILPVNPSVITSPANPSPAVPGSNSGNNSSLFCRICGESIPADSNFCQHCGAKVIR